MKRWLPLIALALALGWLLAGDRWPDIDGGVFVNVPTDTNGDGYADYMLVGDYDNDGTLEAGEIQAAHNALRVSTHEGATKPALTVSTGAACTGATGNCILRNTGSWAGDGFAVGDRILLEGFNHISTGRATLAAVAGGSCAVAGGGGDDCFTTTGTSFVTQGFAVGMKVYAFGFPEANHSDPLQRPFTIVAVDADEMEVSCHGITPGSTGCLTAESARPNRWLISPGVNDIYTISSLVSATELKVSETFPRSEASTPTSSSINAPKVQDIRPITLELAPGDWTAPAALPTGNNRAVLELESFTTLRCDSSSTVIRNDGTTLDNAVIAGRLPWAAGYTRSVRVENCKLDGGWNDGGATNGAAMGFQIQGFWDFEAVGVEVEDTGHTCFYTSNSWDTAFRNFRGKRCGNPRGVGSVTTQAGVYIFATNLAGIDGFAYNVQLENGDISDSGPAYNFRRGTAGDEIWAPVWRDLTARNMANVCAAIRGVYRMHLDGMFCDNTTGFAIDNAASAWGTDTEVRNSDFHNITVRSGTSAATPAFQFGDYHSKVTVENLTVSGSSSTLACVLLQQPNREAVMRNVTLQNCAGDGVQITGVDASAGAEKIAADYGWTLENFTLRALDDGDPFATARHGLQSTVIVANSIFRNWRIDGLTGNGVLFSSGDVCHGCTFENWEVTQMQPRYLGRGTEAFANALTCDANTENYFVITSDASSTSDCTFASGTGASQNACYCDGAGTWADMTVAGGNQDVFNFLGGLTFSTFRNITIRDCRAADAFNVAGDVISNNFDGIRIESTGQWTGINAECVDGLVSDADAQNANNHIEGLSCRGHSGQCFAWNAGAEPTATAGSYDDFDSSSQFPIAANIGGDADCACTTGQIGQVAGTDGFVVCEAALWVDK